MIDEHRDRSVNQADDATRTPPKLMAMTEHTQASAADAVQDRQGTKWPKPSKGAVLHAGDRCRRDEAGRHLKLHRRVRGDQHARSNHSRKTEDTKRHQRARDRAMVVARITQRPVFAGSIERDSATNSVAANPSPARRPRCRTGLACSESCRLRRSPSSRSQARQRGRCQRRAARDTTAPQRPECADREMHRDRIDSGRPIWSVRSWLPQSRLEFLSRRARRRSSFARAV